MFTGSRRHLACDWSHMTGLKVFIQYLFNKFDSILIYEHVYLI